MTSRLNSFGVPVGRRGWSKLASRLGCLTENKGNVLPGCWSLGRSRSVIWRQSVRGLPQPNAFVGPNSEDRADAVPLQGLAAVHCAPAGQNFAGRRAGP